MPAFVLNNWANPGHFFRLFSVFSAINTFLQQITAKNLVSGAGIQTHELLSTYLNSIQLLLEAFPILYNYRTRWKT